MNLEQYRLRRAGLEESQKKQWEQFRGLCPRCRKALTTCFCATIQSFESDPAFAILIHPMESKKRIGTGRMTHLTLKNSFLFEGVTFLNDLRLKNLLEDPRFFPMLLYPSADAVDVGKAEAMEHLRASIPNDKKPLVFVLDGTWFCAKKMLRVNPWLQGLRKIKFTPARHSIYQIRKQPKDFCVSTIEAVQFVIDQWSNSGVGLQSNLNSPLMQSFRYLIETQLKNVSKPNQKALRGNRKQSVKP